MIGPTQPTRAEPSIPGLLNQPRYPWLAGSSPGTKKTDFKKTWNGCFDLVGWDVATLVWRRWEEKERGVAQVSHCHICHKYSLKGKAKDKEPYPRPKTRRLCGRQGSRQGRKGRRRSPALVALHFPLAQRLWFSFWSWISLRWHQGFVRRIHPISPCQTSNAKIIPSWHVSWCVQ